MMENAETTNRGTHYSNLMKLDSAYLIGKGNSAKLAATILTPNDYEMVLRAYRDNYANKLNYQYYGAHKFKEWTHLISCEIKDSKTDRDPNGTIIKNRKDLKCAK